MLFHAPQGSQQEFVLNMVWNHFKDRGDIEEAWRTLHLFPPAMAEVLDMLRRDLVHVEQAVRYRPMRQQLPMRAKCRQRVIAQAMQFECNPTVSRWSAALSKALVRNSGARI